MEGKRPATAEEVKALANPLRLRVLRLCWGVALTNKELAEHLGRDPGTILHHVRVLVRNGFLSADPVRRGARGALERPYRASGKSWQLEMANESGTLAMVDAFRAELAESLPRDLLMLSRLGPRLRARDVRDLRERLEALVAEFKERDDPAGIPVGILVGLHRRRKPRAARGRKG